MFENFLNLKKKKENGPGRKTREEIGKGNQMTALRFHTQGEDIRHPRPSFWGNLAEINQLVYFAV